MTRWKILIAPWHPKKNAAERLTNMIERTIITPSTLAQ
jgi:hypothetical protein